MPDIEIARAMDRLMRRIHAGLNATAADFDTHNLGPAGGILLLTLADLEPAPIKDVVHAMQRDKSQLTRSLHALERKGLVERHADPADGRAVLLTLTQEGRRTAARLNEAVAEVLDGLLSPLSVQERAELKALLARV